MKPRLNIGKIQPEAYTAMDALENYIGQCSIDQATQELIRIKASQINGCAYCVDAHSRDALKAGHSQQKVFLVSAWKEAGTIFTEKERLILQMTEEITQISKQGLAEETYSQAIEVFGEVKTAEIIMVIITINAWNRIGVSTTMKPVTQRVAV